MADGADRSGRVSPTGRTTARARCREVSSSGLAIARALVTRPTVVFADEPTGNLDSTTSGEILALLRQSVDDYNQTTVMVTHDAKRGSDRRSGALPRRWPDLP